MLTITELGCYEYLKEENIFAALKMFENLSKILPVTDNDFLEYISSKEDAMYHDAEAHRHFWRSKSLDSSRWEAMENKLKDTTRNDLQHRMRYMDKTLLQEFQQYGIKNIREAAELTLVDRAKAKHEKDSVAFQYNLAGETLRTDITQ
ncbi:hypothetical protein OAI15_01475 [Flavobacteriaceae bacterium]|nr:hypothetical protein [Flavobacteriaceae bacterium]